MSESGRVTTGVTAGVTSGVTSRRGPEAASTAAAPGRYLARSGNVYVFQIRMPKELGGGRGSKPIRISLGAMPLREARRLADLMAGEARRRFDAMRVSRMDDRNDSDDTGLPEGEVPQFFEGDSHAEVRQGDEFLFRELMRLDDPSKSASSYMQRLFKRAGVEGGNRREVFHSLRAGNIDTMRNAKIEARARKLQAGHAIGDSEHDLYGFRSLNEFEATEMATLALNPNIDFSVFRGLNFDKLAKAKRTMRRRKNP